MSMSANGLLSIHANIALIKNTIRALLLLFSAKPKLAVALSSTTATRQHENFTTKDSPGPAPG